MLIVAWVFHAFVPLVLCLLGVKTVWALSFRCFVSSLTAWAKFLCLRVLLFSLSVELLQILIFWLPYLGFVLPHLSETTFTTLWDSLPAPAVPRCPRCSCACFIHPVAALSRIPRLFLQVKTPTLLGYRKLKTVCDFHTSLTSIKFKKTHPAFRNGQDFTSSDLSYLQPYLSRIFAPSVRNDGRLSTEHERWQLFPPTENWESGSSRGIVSLPRGLVLCCGRRTGIAWRSSTWDTRFGSVAFRNLWNCENSTGYVTGLAWNSSAENQTRGFISRT